jgi:two-component system chemotaxis response regulator CheY
MEVLIVDDSRTMRMIVRRALRQAGFGSWDVREADSGISALEELEKGLPNIVLCDWNMPGMTGIELLETLQARKVKVPFGFVTSENTPQMRARAAAAGARFLLAKPFSPDDLRTVITKVAR